MNAAAIHALARILVAWPRAASIFSKKQAGVHPAPAPSRVALRLLDRGAPPMREQRRPSPMLLLALVSPLLAFGCGTGTGGDGMAPGEPTLEERIDEAVKSIQSDACFAQDDTSQCQWADYEVGPGQFNLARSTGEAILVIDDFGAGLYPQFVRYRNRMLGFYGVNGDRVAAQVLSVHLPRRLGDALVSFAGPEFIPASALTRVGLAAGPAYGKLNLLYYGHGGVVFGHLVELVPEQPIVLLGARLSKCPEASPAVLGGFAGER